YAGGLLGTLLKTIPTELILTNVGNNISSIPKDFILSQNYPNPFNPKTVISYQLAVSNFVTLKVYDAMGKEVATLVNQKQNSGRYQVNFEGSNFSSGVYFYKLNTGGFTDTKRMILIK
ncbi:MAG: T9SS type A sorting domain-containing protein, partial [bacterium]